MKIYIVICLLFVANVLGQPISDEQQALLDNLQKECGKTSGIDEETLKKIGAYQVYPEGDKMKVHAKCVMQAAGVLDDDGKIDAEAVSTILKEIVPGKEKDIVKKCVGADSAGKSAFELGKCIYLEIRATRG